MNEWPRVATIGPMIIVGIKKLEDRLSEYVRIAASGETVLVTDRDRVVAELGPPRPDRSSSPSDAVIAEAIRRGWITPAASRGAPLPPRKPVASLAEILDELAGDRDSR